MELCQIKYLRMLYPKYHIDDMSRSHTEQSVLIVKDVSMFLLNKHERNHFADKSMALLFFLLVSNELLSWIPRGNVDWEHDETCRRKSWRIPEGSLIPKKMSDLVLLEDSYGEWLQLFHCFPRIYNNGKSHSDALCSEYPAHLWLCKRSLRLWL